MDPFVSLWLISRTLKKLILRIFASTAFMEGQIFKGPYFTIPVDVLCVIFYVDVYLHSLGYITGSGIPRSYGDSTFFF